MTTGTYGSSVVPPATNGSWAYRNWNGGNGKYTGLLSQTQWNSYDCEQATMSISQNRLQFRCTRPGGGTDSTWYLDPSIYRSSPDPLNISASQINNALSKIVAKANDHSFNLAVNSSQLKMTADMVVGNLGKLGRAIQAIRHGDFAMAAHQLSAQPRVSQAKVSDIAGRWLELQYGWKPLINDVYDAVQAYHAITEGPRFYRFTSSVHTSGIWTYASPWSPNVSVKQKAKRSRKYIFDQIEAMSAPRQLGLYDPASIVWENTPYSFVVDWFVPIGTYLSNLNQIPFLNGAWHSTEVYGTDGQVEILTFGSSATYPFCGYHGLVHRYDQLVFPPACTRRWAKYQRGSYATPPTVPFPSFDSGGLSDHSSRVWNAIALAYQRFL
jgi:hypothetical protein